MILTVTLNPAVDKTCKLAKFEVGEVNRLTTQRSIAGGKGINVAKILKQFHMQVTVMGFIGGYTGRMISETMQQIGIKTAFTHIKEETRVSTNILDGEGNITEILEPGPEISNEEWKNFLKDYKKQCVNASLIVIAGSIPRGLPSDVYYQLIKVAKEHNKRVILDTSGDAYKKAIEAKPFMIKPNWKELEALMGKKMTSLSEIEEQARLLIENGIERVVISLGKSGLLYVDEMTSIHYKPPKIEVVNTVGCGDTVVAAYCIADMKNLSVYDATKQAVALSAANATTYESGNIPIDTYEKLLLSN